MLKSRPISKMAFALLLLTATSAQSKQQSETPAAGKFVDDIVVIGQTERKHIIHSYLKAAIEPSANDQFARFAKPICPMVRGLPDEHNGEMVKRMRRVANAAKIKVKKEDCRPNIAVLVVHNPKKMMEELRDNYPRIFGLISLPDKDRLVAGPGPTYAWHDVELRSAGGMHAGVLSAQLQLEGTKNTPFSGTTTAKGYEGPASRYRKPMRADMNLSVLLIDIEKTQGIDIRQLADYSLMRLVANTSDKTYMPQDTILTLFADRKDDIEPAQSVTVWDFAMLKSLYKSKADQPSARQRNSMTRYFEKELLSVAAENSSEGGK